MRLLSRRTKQWRTLCNALTCQAGGQAGRRGRELERDAEQQLLVREEQV